VRRRVSVQDGSSPSLACTAEVGFFYVYRYIYARAHMHTHVHVERRQEDEDENEDEDEKDEEEEIGTDIRGHTEFLTSPGSL